MKRLTGLALTAVLIALAPPAAAQRGWTLLGQSAVSDRAERDVIKVAGARRFSQVRLCVYRHGVRFYDVDIRFRNDGNQDVRLRSSIPINGCTGPINLRGGRRDIEEVAFSYEALSLGRRGAQVRLLAR